MIHLLNYYTIRLTDSLWPQGRLKEHPNKTNDLIKLVPNQRCRFPTSITTSMVIENRGSALTLPLMGPTSRMIYRNSYDTASPQVKRTSKKVSTPRPLAAGAPYAVPAWTKYLSVTLSSNNPRARCPITSCLIQYLALVRVRLRSIW